MRNAASTRRAGVVLYIQYMWRVEEEEAKHPGNREGHKANTTMKPTECKSFRRARNASSAVSFGKTLNAGGQMNPTTTPQGTAAGRAYTALCIEMPMNNSGVLFLLLLDDR